MTDEAADLGRIRREIDYYRRQLDEVAADNIKLDITISGLRHELTQKKQGFALLSGLQQSIGAHQQISSIFEITIRAINHTLGMDRTVVLTQTDKEHHYRPSQWLGLREEAAGQLSSRTIRFPPEFAAGSGLLVVNRSTPKTPLIEEIQAAFGLPYFVCLPVMLDKAPIGLLLSGRLVESEPFSPPLDQGDVDTFQAIAGLISASVRNLQVAVLEEMDRLKTEFFANLSHEFRTPLTLTLGPLKGILDGRYGEVQAPIRDQLLVMQRNQQRLLGLINQILDLAKLEAGGMQLKAAPVRDMNRFIEERVGGFRSVAEERGIELRISLDPRVLGAELYVDREKFDKLLLNLLSNAYKFTKAGHVKVSTQIYDGTFRLTVSDTGIGIKADQIPFLFDRFRQADGSASREYAGTGIGLAWVKEIAELHGGDVTVHSQYGRGSTFRVSIPLGKAHLSPASVVEFEEEDLPALADSQKMLIISEGATDQEGVDHLNRETEASFDPSKATILYAEDNRDMRNHVRDLLKADYNVFLAVDGRDGLEKARLYKPELLVVDHMMPHMSGRDLLQQVRADAELSSVPVVFLTARAGTEARIESLAAGADDYLTKPFHEEELRVRVKNLVRARAQERRLAEVNCLLQATIEEQMAELMRTGELKHFLPQAVAEGLLKGKLAFDHPCARRRITVLFVDMVGFTDLTDYIEPEEQLILLNEFLREMSAVAVAQSGAVVQITGDALMVLFGAPRACTDEDHAWSSIQAASNMRARAQDLGVHWRRRGIPYRLDVRVGINTGYCTVGVFGSDLLQVYTANGTPVNIAARLQTEAEAGEILCGFSTYALVADRVLAEARAPVLLHGIARPVEAYTILGLVDSLDAG
jgi:signal transduction histidine kinase/class 3 adenylate cyclase